MYALGFLTKVLTFLAYLFSGILFSMAVFAVAGLLLHNQNSISSYKKDTSHFDSDRGFYYYHGKLTKLTDTSFSISLTERYCHYCATPVEKQADGSRKRIFRTKYYLCRWVNDGFWANEIFYKRSEAKDD